MRKVILPVIEFHNDMRIELKITHYLDKDGHKYQTLDELFNSFAEDTEILLYNFEIFWSVFEDWCNTNNIEKKFTKSIYRGHPKYNFYVPCLVSTRPKPSIDDMTSVKFYPIRLGYQGYTYKLYDISQIISGIELQVPFHRLKTDEEFANELTDIVRPQKFARTLCGFDRFKIASNCPWADINRLMIRAYAGGLTYLRKDRPKTYSVVYDYDITSMYPYIMTDKDFPDIDYAPRDVEGFEEAPVAFYHISSIFARLKPHHIPCVVWDEEKRNGIESGFPEEIIAHSVEEHLGWITSVDYRMLRKYYEILDLKIDNSIIFDYTKSGKDYFGSTVKSLFEMKQKAPRHSLLRSYIKTALDSISGSLAMITCKSYKIDSLASTEEDGYSIENNYESPYVLAAFITAYGRELITNYADKVPFNEIICIDTDGIFTTKPQPQLLTNESSSLGAMRLDEVMYNVKWFAMKQYVFDTEGGEVIPHIAGLPAYLYEDGLQHYMIPRYIRKTNGGKPHYYMDFKAYNLGDYRDGQYTETQ